MSHPGTSPPGLSATEHVGASSPPMLVNAGVNPAEHAALQQLAAQLQQQHQQLLAHNDTLRQQMQQQHQHLQQMHVAVQQAQAQGSVGHSPASAGPAPLPHHVRLTIGELPPFTGAGAATAAEQWLAKVEYRFGAAASMLGMAHVGDAARLVAAASSLSGDADSWFVALRPAPASWQEFVDQFRARFLSVATTDFRLNELRRLISSMQRIRAKLNVDGLRRFATKFQQLASEIPESVLSAYLRRQMFAEGLPQRLCEWALTQNRSSSPPELHTLVNSVLAKAMDRAMSEVSSSTIGAADSKDMEVDAVSLCAAQLGLTPEEAASCLSTATESPSGSVNSVNEVTLAAVTKLATALGSRQGYRIPKNAGRRSGSSIREVPEALAEGRKTAGLCIKCGIRKYEKGGKGHNSRNCQAPVDKTTTVEDGKRLAGF